MVNIYEYNEKDFNHRGTPLKNFLKCEITEALNGVYELNFEYPLESGDSHLLENGKILQVDNYDGKQLFRILYLQKDLDTIKGYALHISYDLLGNFIEDIYIQGMNGTRALQEVLNRSTDPHKFVGVSDITKLRNSRLVRKNTLEAIMGDKDNSLLSRWGGELYRDNFRINWLEKIGSDKGVTIKYAKNLTGIEYKIDLSHLVTHFIPKGFDGLLLPEKYVISPLAEKYKPIVKRKLLELEDVKSKKVSPTQEDAVDHDQALALLREKSKKAFELGADKPEITCTVAFIDLSQTEEYKNYAVLEKIYLGDTVGVQYKGINVLTRCVGYTYDCLQNRYIHVELGNTPQQNLLANAINNQQALITKIEEVERSNVEKAKEAIKDSLNDGLGSNIKYYSDRILIMDTNDEATAKVVWKFNSNGLSVSTTGVNGNFRLATTKDGKFFAEIITGLKINSEMIETGAIDFKHLSSTVFSKVREGLVTKEGLSEFLVTNEGLRQKMNQIISEEFETKKQELKGDSSYIHKKYSNNANGTPMTDDTNSKYMGIYTGTSKTPPVNASDYNWIKIKFEERLVKGYANSKTGLDFTTVEPVEESKLIAKNRPRVRITNNNDISDIWQANDEVFLKPNTYYRLTARAKGNTNELYAYIMDYNTKEIFANPSIVFSNNLETKTKLFKTPPTMSGNNIWLKFILQPEDANWEGVEVDWWTIQEAIGTQKLEDFPLNEPAQYQKFRYFGYTNVTDGNPTADKFEWFDLQKKSMQTDKYTHLVYSDNADGTDFGKAPKKYMGIARTTSPVTPTNKEDFKWFKITGEDGHSLNAYLRLEGSYLNGNIANFGAYVKVMYDGIQISNFDISHSYRGASFQETSNQASTVDSNGLITNLGLNANKTDGTPLYVDITVKYKGLTSVASARLDNTVDVELVNNTINKFKTFESTLDKFESKIGEISKQKFKMAYNIENLCSETNSEKKGNDLYFNTKRPLEANKYYYILAYLKNAPEGRFARIYYADDNGDNKLITNGLNVWRVKYSSQQTRVNIFSQGSDTTIKNVEVYEVPEIPFPEEDVLYAPEKIPNNVRSSSMHFRKSLQKNTICTAILDVEGETDKTLYFFNGDNLKVQKNLVTGKNYWTFLTPIISNGRDFEIQGTKGDVTISQVLLNHFDKGYRNEYNISEMESAVKQTKSEIEHAVRKDNFGTVLTQNAEYLRLAWNNISKFIQFENGSMSFYEGGQINNNKLVARLNDSGYQMWRDGYYLGAIGTNSYKEDVSKKGIQFDLNYDGWFMGWAYQTQKNANYYNWKWVYSSGNFASYKANTLNAGCDIDLHGYKLRNGYINPTEFRVEGGVTTDSYDFMLADGRSLTIRFKNGFALR